jgi:hypothetical protein
MLLRRTTLNFVKIGGNWRPLYTGVPRIELSNQELGKVCVPVDRHLADIKLVCLLGECTWRGE